VESFLRGLLPASTRLSLFLEGLPAHGCLLVERECAGFRICSIALGGECESAGIGIIGSQVEDTLPGDGALRVGVHEILVSVASVQNYALAAALVPGAPTAECGKVGVGLVGAAIAALALVAWTVASAVAAAESEHNQDEQE
jgi:hypothetical protein